MKIEEAWRIMAEATASKLDACKNDFSDSDYDVLENYMEVTRALLVATYEGDFESLPGPEEAPWCPNEIMWFLMDAKQGQQK